ncbi:MULTISPECIES: hypothetical protein [Streptomyces]|uniref:hypothetical protein n=1 Tax=Streptomyces TaxID=1883 RepID=UPI0019635B62|nr:MULTISPECIES: hypothetical protein [Streptomyces]QRX91073.1 hypothetical protein JNO44_09715 [Streptomyces noursei]UJB40922.1 hypothetical protein HRD51_08900 [Streptomyces sp. A1-5]
MTTLALAGIGPVTTTWDPPLIQSVTTSHVKDTGAFTSLSLIGEPQVLLLADKGVGTVTGTCVGAPQAFNFSGTLEWSDEVESAYTVTALTQERVEGHTVNRSVATITSGRLTGAQINFLAIRLGDQLTGCLTGGGVSSAKGYEIILITTS